MTKYDNITDGEAECWQCPTCGADHCEPCEGHAHPERRAAAIAELQAGDDEVERMLADPNFPEHLRPENTLRKREN